MRPGVAVLAVGAALTLAACSPRASGPSTDSIAPPSPTPPPSASAPEPSDAPAPAESDYADGEYSATGWYGGLPSHQDVTLTIDDDVVTAVEITTPAEDETSLGYQQRFAEALPAAVIGLDVDEIAIDRLAGSSGCSEGFMDALAQITRLAAVQR